MPLTVGLPVVSTGAAFCTPAASPMLIDVNLRGIIG
jgi:hypothetical protein